MSIETTRPVCNVHHDACACRHWETMKILNELNQAQVKIREQDKKIGGMEKQYSDLVLSLSKQVEIDR